MLLDKILLDKLAIIGEFLLNKADLNSAPQNTDEMIRFINTLRDSVDIEEFEGLLIGNILFHFVSSIEVRDRQVTSRIFENIFSGLFSLEPTDIDIRENPIATSEILALDSLCENENWTISQDLQGNKREKADLAIHDYKLSLKTLKGKAYNEDGVVIDKTINKELNVGSLSFRSLLKGIMTDDEIRVLRDRQGGLGSGAQIRKNMLTPIRNRNRQRQFHTRISLFVNYVYTEDIIIVLKSHYKIEFILIPADSFSSVLTKLYRSHEENFTDVWYRWENNNLRLNWPNMLTYMDEFSLNYSNVSIDLSKSVNNERVSKFLEKIGDYISLELKNMSLN